MGTLSRKEQIRRIRREDIIDAAERVFFAKGFTGSTVDDIAREAQYSKRTLYIYFTSKEQLYDAVVLRGYQALNRMYERAFAEQHPASGLAKVILMGDTYLDFIERHPQYFEAMILYPTRTEDLTDQDELKAANYREGNVGADLLIAALREGSADGSIAADLDPVNTAFILYANIIGVGQLILRKAPYIAQTYQRSMTDLVAELRKLIVRSLKP